MVSHDPKLSGSRIRFLKLIALLVLLFPFNSCWRSGNTVMPKERQVAGVLETININTAEINDFERLPGIGPKTAAGIVAHRERFGAFRRVEYLMLVDGISDSRFNKISRLVSVD